MKHTIRLLALLLALLLTFCACSSQNLSADAYDAKAEYDSAPSVEYDMVYEESIEEEAVMDDGYAAEEPMSSFSTAEQGEMLTADSVNEKIIYSGHVNLETTTFDQTLSALALAVEQSGGFIQDSNVQGRTSYNSDGTTTIVDRWAYYTVRIPSQNFNNFMSMTNGMGNVTASNRSAQNVTSQYTDYEARLNSLTIQEERLLDMLEKSGDLDSLITMEARLSEVRYEIESIQRNLRNLDQRISYSTVDLDIREVEIYTPTTPVTRTFGEKMADAFRDGWNGFVRGIQRFCIWFAESLPTLVILAVIAAAAATVVLKLRKKRRQKRLQQPEAKSE